MTAQLSYASNGLANSRDAVLTDGTVDGIPEGFPRSQYTWQTLVLLGAFQSGAENRSDTVAYARFDTPHKSIPSPWLLAQWSEDFGWHRSLEQIATHQRPLPTKSVFRDATSTRIELHAQTSRSPAEFASPQQTSAAAQAETVAHAHLNQMLAEAAHDIRSPITVAQQIISTLSHRIRQHGQLTSAESLLLDEAQMRLTQANRWAEGILVEQSLAHGQPVNVRRRFYPHQWLQGVRPLLNSLAIQRGVTLAWLGWDRSLPRLYLDANHLSRAVLNLVSNAIQASRPESQVRIEVAWQTQVTQRLVITIDDQAGGLSAKQLRTVNSPTASLTSDEQTSSRAGLGLKTAKTLIRALGGVMTAQRSTAGGTLFRLQVPVDNYHSLIHSWLQQNNVSPTATPENPARRITIHALRSERADDAMSVWREVDTRLQQGASSQDLVYRVAPDRWLWLTIHNAASPTVAMPLALSEALSRLRERDNAWNLPLNCRQQQVFQWEPQAAGNGRSRATGSVQLLSLTSMLAEKIAELMGNHVPPIDELQSNDTPIVIRTQTGGPARLIRNDAAQAFRPAAPAALSAPLTTPLTTPLAPTRTRSTALPAAASGRPILAPSLADTPCDSFSGTLAEMTQQWHLRQQHLARTHASLGHTRFATTNLSDTSR